MQARIRIFWESEDDQARFSAFYGISEAGYWDVIERLYTYLWRANFDEDPSDRRYATNLREKILFDSRIVDGLKTWSAAAAAADQPENAHLYLMKNRLMRCWRIETNKPIGHLRERALNLF